MRKLLPVILAMIGLGAGGGAGYFLRPAAAPEPAEHAETADGHAENPAEHAAPADGHGAEDAMAATREYVKMNNQFIVPLVDGGRVSGIIIMALSLEVKAGNTEAVYSREPKLRDAFLQILFDHANAGGFNGVFTDGSNLVYLRKAMLEAAQKNLGDVVLDILISDLARQDS